MVNRLLKSNGFALSWIEQKREIEQLVKTLRRDLCTLASQAPSSLSLVEKIAVLAETARKINHKIFDYNLAIPSSRFHHPFLDFAKECAAANLDDPHVKRSTY